MLLLLLLLSLLLLLLLVPPTNAAAQTPEAGGYCVRSALSFLLHYGESKREPDVWFLVYLFVFCVAGTVAATPSAELAVPSSAGAAAAAAAAPAPGRAGQHRLQSAP